MWRREGGHLRAAVLVDECDAFLAGHYAEHLVTKGEGVPVWAWVNLLAHGTEEELRRALHPAGSGRRDDPWRPWWEARSYLAGEILDLVDTGYSSIGEIQAGVLVPLELDLASRDRLSWWGPGQLVATVRTALHEQRNWRRRPTGG